MVRSAKHELELPVVVERTRGRQDRNAITDGQGDVAQWELHIPSEPAEDAGTAPVDAIYQKRNALALPESLPERSGRIL
jgi:hypothetical protein